MRIIKFRAKDINGKWVYGSILINYYDRICDSIVYADIEGTDIYDVGERRLESALVNYDTIGQFTGLCDSNGKKIYEGDLLECDEVPKILSEVYWNCSMSAFCFAVHTITEGIDYGTTPLGDVLNKFKSLHIVGNIYDNPELLKGGEK